MAKPIKIILKLLTGILLAIVLIILIGLIYYFSLNTKDTKVLLEKNHMNITYKETESGPLKLDLYMPKRKLSSKIPVLVYFHGGSWNSGSKRLNNSDMQIFNVFLEEGFALVSVDYRLTNEKNKYPVHLNDGADAIRWILQNAETYGLNKKKINLIGASAGAQIASILGMSGGQFGDNKDPAEFKIRSIVDLCGPKDLTDLSDFPPDGRKYIEKILLEYFGEPMDKMEDQYRLASPIFQINKKSPPIFMAHGKLDEIIPYQQAEKFYQKAKSVHANVTYVLVENVNHEFQAISDKEPDPPLENVVIRIALFLLKHNLF